MMFKAVNCPIDSLPHLLDYEIYAPLNLLLIKQVFNEKPSYCNAEVVGGRAGGRVGVRASTFGFRSITLVCFGLLTPNMQYG